MSEPGADATRLGTVHTEGGRAVIRFERDLEGPPAVVWRALTEPSELEAWFPCRIDIGEWEVGSAMVFRFPGHGDTVLTGTVLARDEPRLLVYTWGDEVLRFELSPTPAGGTRLVRCDVLSGPTAARNAAGWDVCLERLVGRAPAAGAWRPLFEHYAARFSPLLGPQEGPPPGFEDA
ncbi:MAG TPA: SRPBCC domain-containing protein [Acidimicrobiales bacterium]|nr:SRPBCC domain-containing protein [Acidimicrobiales bacterium]